LLKITRGSEIAFSFDTHPKALILVHQSYQVPLVGCNLGVTQVNGARAYEIRNVPRSRPRIESAKFCARHASEANNKRTHNNRNRAMRKPSLMKYESAQNLRTCKSPNLDLFISTASVLRARATSDLTAKKPHLVSKPRISLSHWCPANWGGVAPTVAKRSPAELISGASGVMKMVLANKIPDGQANHVSRPPRKTEQTNQWIRMVLAVSFPLQ
jgi:hypothetical protein